MKKKTVIAIVAVALLALVGVFFGIAKASGALNDTLTGNTEQDPSELTWYAAKLPGAEQVYFHTFNNNEVNVPGVELYGEFYNKDGHLEVQNYGDVVLYNLTDYSLSDYDPADVYVIDFDLWHPTGTPDTSFDSEYVRFSNRYYLNFTESGGTGDPVNKFCITCENFPGDGNFDACFCILGDDFTKKIHVTIIKFADNTTNYYLNGQYLYTDRPGGYTVGLSLSSFAISPDLADDTVLDYGSIAIDNIECVKFGDGTGSYNGFLMDYKTNTSLKISDLMEVN